MHYVIVSWFIFFSEFYVLVTENNQLNSGGEFSSKCRVLSLQSELEGGLFLPNILITWRAATLFSPWEISIHRSWAITFL